MNNFINSVNWDAVSGIVGSLNVVITGILTFIIINQTKKLNRNQNELEEKLSEKQLQLQKRQIKVDVFPYKREIYLNLLQVLEFSHFLSKNIMTLDLEKKSAKEVYEIYIITRDTYLKDTKSITTSLREAEYILPPNISSSVTDIYQLFDNICSQFIVFGTLHGYFTENELKETLIHGLEDINQSLKIINSKASFIHSIMPIELSIADLDS